MIALRIELNGRVICTAGAEDLGVLSAVVDALGVLGSEAEPLHEEEVPPLLSLAVGGMTRPKDGDQEHPIWIARRRLSVGDQISITVLDTSEADPPSSYLVRGRERREYSEKDELRTVIEI